MIGPYENENYARANAMNKIPIILTSICLSTLFAQNLNMILESAQEGRSKTPNKIKKMILNHICRYAYLAHQLLKYYVTKNLKQYNENDSKYRK
jgi:hypothetical protein